ncbi:L,D-transpeptidase family protein [Synergistaceae bacterium OttesenSCG-928-I11]|nr:L,D-transpeptidase family protein [Synergistaceae bacterium OttesenSCG-928-I11]
MFGFRRREWKHARREEIAYLKELVAVGCLLALIMGVLGFLAETDGKTPYATLPDPPPATNASLPSPEENLTPQKKVEPASAPGVSPKAVSPRRDARSGDVDERALDGIDPLATPEVFDRFDEWDASIAFENAVLHVPDWPLASQRREMSQPRIHVVIDKASHTLTLFRGSEVVRQYGIAVGKNPGDKTRAGDNRTPEGVFPVQQIHDAAHWVHDFGDGKGVIEGAYGPLFIRLGTPPWKGIGIHGTHDPDSIGTNATEGCVRMHNDELLELAEILEIGMTVTILPNS